jgi:hypothetical protein
LRIYAARSQSDPIRAKGKAMFDFAFLYGPIVVFALIAAYAGACDLLRKREVAPSRAARSNHAPQR